MNNNMDIEKLAYNHGANIYENGEVRFYTLNAFTKFAEAYHQAKCNEELQTLRAKVEVLVEALCKVQKNLKRPINTVNGSVTISFTFVDEALANYNKLSEVKHDTK